MANQITTGTPAVRGRPFARGNGGRRHGSKNKNSLILEALSDSEKEQLVRKGIELAKAGDVSMLKFFLSRILAAGAANQDRSAANGICRRRRGSDRRNCARRYRGIDHLERRCGSGKSDELLCSRH